MGDGILIIKRSGLSLVPKEIEIPAVEAEAAPIQSSNHRDQTKKNSIARPVETIYPLIPPAGGYIRLSNWLIDTAMPELSGNAFKLLNFLYRQTLFSKDERDRVEGREFSNLELIRGTGIGSFSTIQEAISELEGSPTKKRGNARGRVYIIVSNRGGWDKVRYRINLSLEIIVPFIEPSKKISRAFERLKTNRSVTEIFRLRSCRYKEFLLSCHWKTITRYLYQIRGRICEICGDTKTGFNVHHKTYAHRGEEFDYLEDLIILCRECHQNEHQIIEL